MLPEIVLTHAKAGEKAPPFPAKSHEGDAGWDICAGEPKNIERGSTVVVETGYKVGHIPEGWEIQVRSRSGLAAKHGVCVLNSPGTIDSSYRGDIKVILHNTGPLPFTVNVGDRIAQLVPKKVEPINIRLGDSEESTETSRGQGGFGSTGR